MKHANGSVTEADELRRVIADCMPWVSVVEPFGLFNFLSDECLIREAMRYRPSVDALLRSFCIERESDEGGRIWGQALEFLQEHTQHIKAVTLKEVFYDEANIGKFNYTSAELAQLKEEHNRYWADWKNCPLNILSPSKDYTDIADPICDFLLSEYQEYRSQERSRLDKKDPPVFPIFVCPSCNKLVMPERSGRKRYCSDCSDRARAQKYRQKASPEENKDYQWLYRLRGCQPDVRKMLLKNPKCRTRLGEIKARQKQSTRCQRLLLELKSSG